MDNKTAVGFIETKGLAGTIAALDAALKAAAVALASFVRVRGGTIVFAVEGEVSAVSAAIDGASEVALKLNSLINRHVIPSPDAQSRRLIKQRDGGGFSKIIKINTIKETNKIVDESKTEDELPEPDVENLSTVTLRRMLRDCNDGRYEGRAISRMRKDQIIKALREMKEK